MMTKMEIGGEASSSSKHKERPVSLAGGSNKGGDVDPRIVEARKKLPIWQGRQSIINAVRENDTVVVLGETGCGKTTQIPQYLYEAGLTAPWAMDGKSGRATTSNEGMLIGITQPRRVPAISLAKRVAVEMGASEPGRDEKKRGSSSDRSGSSLVGYSIRFDDRSGQETRIKFMTDGWLLREMLNTKKQKKNGKSNAVQAQKRYLFMETAKPQDEGRKHSLLEQFSVLIIDEAHERSVHTDVVLGLAKRIQRERKKMRQSWLERSRLHQLSAEEEDREPQELKVIIMSATIDAESFANFFSDGDSKPAPILYIKGRQYPIQLYHSAEVCQDWMQSCKKLILQINDMAPGDILVFMTGAEEIDAFATDLQELNRGIELYAEGMGKKKPMSLVVVKLYAALGSEAIRKCFLTTPPGCRKVVLATNIAETSITISGINYVIDCGLAKERTFRSSMGGLSSASAAVSGASMDMLETKPISKSAARQRAGRAGRESGGSCFRLFREETFDSLAESTMPEILRTDLSSVVLDVFAMGLDPVDFDWLDRPDEESLRAAVLTLVELGALEMAPKAALSSEQRGLGLTKLGEEMATLPLVPQLSKTLLSARDCNDAQVMSQALDLVAILSTERKTILVEPTSRTDDLSGGRKREEADRARERLSHPSGDHATQLKALAAFTQVQHEAESSQPQSSASAIRRTKADGRAAGPKSKIQEWCALNFVSLKSVREALRIRAQLHQVCIKQGWITPLASAPSSFSHLKSGASSSDDDDGDNSDSDADLVVSRGGNGTAGQVVATGRGADSEDDYAMIRRCLIQGKQVNTAMRQGESNLYQRAHGGSERFKIHPSSSLLFRKPLPSVIFFEDIFVTTQIFARTVSAAEPSWLADLIGEVKNRKRVSELHQSAQ